MSELKKGYATGVIATFAFLKAVEGFLATSKTAVVKTKKPDNDDLDVTKGCEIVVTLSDKKTSLTLNRITHKPYILNNIELYAGQGVGVVTKDGLKPPKGYPAINPIPLKAFKDVIKKKHIPQRLYCTVSVTDGEELAKQTANEKVGVLGGISILGTSGFVKPVSAVAYLESIKTELDFIKINNYKKVVLTLGNTSLKEAKKSHHHEQIVEIGNFVYDAISEAIKRDLDVVLYIGVAKAVKVAQGFKNTHNRFGFIDFEKLQEWVGVSLDGVLTVRKVLTLVDEESFRYDVKKRAKKMLKTWFKKDIQICLQ